MYMSGHLNGLSNCMHLDMHGGVCRNDELVLLYICTDTCSPSLSLCFQNLKSTLPSGTVTSLHREIDAGLDIDLIKQQLQQGVLNIQSLASFVVSVMARSCAPVRDSQIQDLRDRLTAGQLSVPAIFQ